MRIPWLALASAAFGPLAARLRARPAAQGRDLPEPLGRFTPSAADLTHPDNVVQALDGATGELIWEQAYDYPPAAKTLGGPLRNIAIHGDKLFLATYDAALVALDAPTGKLAWRTVKADYRKG